MSQSTPGVSQIRAAPNTDWPTTRRAGRIGVGRWPLNTKIIPNGSRVGPRAQPFSMYLVPAGNQMAAGLGLCAWSG
jgi:hypothetical protein